MTPEFFEAMKWTALAIVSVTVMVCLLECRKEMQERRSKEKFEFQLRHDEQQRKLTEEFAKTLDCYADQIAALKNDLWMAHMENERLQRKNAQQKSMMAGKLVVDIRRK